MARNNPSNPFTQDPAHTQKEVQMPVQKAKVMAAEDHPDEDAFHTIRIRVYGDQATYRAPVLAPMFGSVWIPQEGEDVAVIFGDSDKPFVIGVWYPLDRVESGEALLPDYEAGDIRLGNETGSHVTVENDGSITIQTDDRQPINIDRQVGAAYMGTDQDVAGDNAYHIVEFDTEEDDVENLFTPSTHEFQVLHEGMYEVNSTIEFPLSGQNNVYTIAIFVNGSMEKRKSRQSSVNEPLSLSVELNKRLDAEDIVDVRIRQNSGSIKTINGTQMSNSFNIERKGV